jgi:hypothetical protein
LDNDNDADTDCCDDDCSDDDSCTSETNCTDGADNDCDEKTDCADSDCASGSDCTETGSECTNSKDDDGDGDTDCSDSDCSSHATCQPETKCTNGLDDDSDGKTDCCDTDCSDDDACKAETNCTDNADNDCDEKTDCADSDCLENHADCTETGSECTNSADDDSDGDTDCADSDCSSHATCNPESNCSDYVDNDADGNTDCADSDCASNSACTETGSECSNSKDDDGDGNTDCADSDCASLCPETNCSNSVDDDSDGKTDCKDDDCSKDAACTETGSECANGKDDDSDGDTDCDDSDCKDEDVCNPESKCTDYVDNDADGATDCKDSDCASNAACTETDSECTNKKDDDGDGDTDCNDSDCGTSGYCPETNCSNKVDDDADGSTDCDDDDCAKSCPETNCSDGNDNDGDGDIDCCDTEDCSKDKSCGSESSCTDGSDNDCDGSTDCCDSDCEKDANCVSETDCGDGNDNDCDYATDCDDDDCAAESECSGGGEYGGGGGEYGGGGGEYGGGGGAMCGDGECTEGEESIDTCPDDCCRFACGNGTCDSMQCRETSRTCPPDCSMKPGRKSHAGDDSNEDIFYTISKGHNSSLADVVSIKTLSTTIGYAVWPEGSSQHTLAAGDYTLSIYMGGTGIYLLGAALDQTSNAGTGSPYGQTSGPNDYCTEQCSTPAYTEDNPTSGACTVGKETSTEWNVCGLRLDQQCCDYSEGSDYCLATGSTCSSNTPETVMGQTFSKPQVALVTIGSTSTWVAFFASGYNNRHGLNAGRSVYGINLFTGAKIGQWDLPEIEEDSDGDADYDDKDANPSSLQNTLPGGLAAADLDKDGDTDVLYFGDLEGRLWKIDISSAGTTTSGLNDNWKACVLFDAGVDNASDKTRVWAPISMKPAVSVMGGEAYVYFGTGGDDRAPASETYRFYAVKDDVTSVCSSSVTQYAKYYDDLSVTNLEWTIGDGKDNTSAKNTLTTSTSEGVAGDKYWADPLIVNERSIYFVSTRGSALSVDPCSDMVAGTSAKSSSSKSNTTSKAFAYAITTYNDYSGNAHSVGQSIFDTDYKDFSADEKFRYGFMLRGASEEAWTRTPASSNEATANDVIAVSGGGSSEPEIALTSDPGFVAPGVRMRILRWREIEL